MDTKIKMKVTVIVRKGGNRSSRVAHIYCLRTTHTKDGIGIILIEVSLLSK